MKNKKSLYYIIMPLLLCIVACLGFGVVYSTVGEKSELSFDGELKETYCIGETISIPVATINDVKAEHVVNLPNNTSVNADTVSLKICGDYFVDYYANYNGKTYSATKKFKVLSPMFSIDGTGTLAYVEPTENVSGVVASLTQDSSLIYNDSIDLKKFDNNTPFIKLATLPQIAGEGDVAQFKIIITDAYDENINFVIAANKCDQSTEWDYKVSYFSLAFNGGKTVGLDLAENGKYTIFNSRDKKEYNYRATIDSAIHGTNMMFSMTGGSPGDKVTGETTLGLMYDYESMQMFITLCRPSGEIYYTQLMADLNLIDAYGTTFPGFTDGKVKIQITPTVMLKTHFNVFIPNINGISVNEKNYNAYTSAVKPVISVSESEFWTDKAPDARVGTPYKIFNATATDMIDNRVDVQTKVYYGYSNTYKSRIQIKDGCFTPNFSGVYTVEYSAVNSLGLKTVKTVDVTAVKDDSELQLVLDNEIDYLRQFKAGEKLCLLSGYRVDNAFGKYYLNVKAFLSDNPEISYTLNESNNYEFTPLYSGEYVLEYNFGDYNINKTETKKLTVNKNNMVFYETFGSVPRYLIKNGKYDLDVVKASSIANGILEQVDVKIYYRNDGETDTHEVNGQYLANAKNAVKFLYVPAVDFDVEPFTINSSVIDVGLGESLDMSKFFISDSQIAFTANADGIACDASAISGGSSSFEFVNLLQRHTFRSNIAPLIDASGSYKEFERINIRLIDSENAEDFIKISLYKSKGIYVASVNDGNPVKLATTWASQTDEFDVSCNFNTNMCSINGGIIKFDLNNYYLSEKPVKFENRIRMSVEIIGTNPSGILFRSLNGQSFSDNTDEYVGPNIDVTRDKNAGEKNIGETIVLNPFLSYDVLSVNVNATLKVSGPKGILTSLDGTYLENADAAGSYSFMLNDYGTYTVLIVSSDISNNVTRYSYNIYVKDYSNPEIEIESCVTSGKVGKETPLAKYSVSNRKIKDCKCYYVIYKPDGTMELIKEQDVFVPAYSGEYTVSIFVLDKNGNLSQKRYTLSVS